MKNLFFALITFMGTFSIQAQVSEMPSVNIKDINGKVINTSTFENGGKPMVISFWATWCKPCIRELTAINDMYIDWQDETGVKVIAISIDDARNSGKVKPFINGQGWEYEVYIDENSDLKRALGVVNIPHTFLIDGNGKIVWQHTGYQQGDEEHLLELIEKLAAGESIEHL